MTELPKESRRGAAIGMLVTNYAGMLISLGKGILIVPLLISSIGLDLYGAWLASGNLLAIVGTFEAGLGLALGQRLAVAHASGDQETFAHTSGSGMALFSAIGLAIAGVSCLVSPFVPDLLNAPANSHESLVTAFRLAGLGAGIQIAFVNLFNIPFAWQRTKIPGVVRLGAQGLELSIIAFGVNMGLGVISLGLATLLSAVVGLVAGGAYVAREWSVRRLPVPRPRAREIRDLGRIGIASFASRLGSTAAANVEPIILSAFAGPNAAGVYGLSVRLFQTLQSFINPVFGSVFFALASLHGEGQRDRVREVIGQVFGINALCMLALPVFASVNSGFVRVWVGAEYFAGGAFNAVACVAALLAVRSSAHATVLSALGEITSTAWATLAETGVRVAALLVLIPSFGLIGVPVAACAGLALVALPWQTRLLVRVLEIPFRGVLRLEANGLRGLIAGFAAAAAFLTVTAPTSSWIGLGIYAAFCGLAVAGAALLVDRPLRARALKLAQHLSRASRARLGHRNA